VPSYSPVFSSQFILYTDATPNLSFAVPAGFTAVVRDVTFYATVAGTLCQVAIQDSEDAEGVTVVSEELAGVGVYVQWTGRIVVPAGGLINLVLGSLAAGVNAYVGGYLLRNTLS
jgi:hypothetical protein